MSIRELVRHNLAQVPIEDVEATIVSAVAAHLGVGCADVWRANPHLGLQLEQAIVNLAREIANNVPGEER